MSYSTFNVFSTSAVRFEAKSSDGFGGTGPDASNDTRSTWGNGWTAADKGTSPKRTELNPTSLLTPKNSWIRGRRRSQHTMTTRWPDRARATPRLAMVVVFP